MLWTEKYRPCTFSEILGQEPVIQHLSSFAASRALPHIILTGPHGTGKSAAIGCLARTLYQDNWELNTTIVSVADLFSQGKSFLEQDERYAHIYQKNQSLIANFKYILKWYASLRPLDAEFKLMVFEDAHALTRDAQQALRRIMERTSTTCRFIFTTTNPSAIIPAISSRCLPLFFAPVRQDIMLQHLLDIRSREAASAPAACTDDDLDLIVQAAAGDMRRGVLLLQAALTSGSCEDLLTHVSSENATIAAHAINALRDGDVRGAIRRLESLMIDYGLSGSEVLSEARAIVQREYNHPLLAISLADADYRLTHANNEYLQIGAFATGVRDVFS
ncbi:MAG TPA: AAA family ATPase [Methanoregula sp.]|nr:AAA family ATPase [Methanoregula sp.]